MEILFIHRQAPATDLAREALTAIAGSALFSSSISVVFIHQGLETLCSAEYESMVNDLNLYGVKRIYIEDVAGENTQVNLPANLKGRVIALSNENINRLIQQSQHIVSF